MKRAGNNLIQILNRSLLTGLALLACLALALEPAGAQRPIEKRSSTDGSTTYIYADDRYGRDGTRTEVTEKDGERIVFRQWRDAQGLRLEEERTTYSGPKTELDPTGNEKTVVTRYFIYLPSGGGRQLSKETTTKTSITGTEYSSETKQFDEKGVQIGGSKTEKDSTGRTKTYRWDPQGKKYVEEAAGVSLRTSRERAADMGSASLETMDGIKRSTSASPGYQAANTVATGLSTATFTTPQGTIYVNLPSDAAAGDTLSGTVIAEPKSQDPKQRTKNQSELGEYVVELGQQRSSISAGRFLRLALPTAISTTRYLVLRDKKGKEVCRSEVPIASTLPTGGDFTLPTIAQQGRPLEILGSFDGNLDTTRVSIGGQDMQLLAESPRRMIARNTSERVGVMAIELREGSQVRRAPFRSLGISLSAPKLSLLRGEGTTLTIVVTGLEDLRESIPLVIENKSPGVISMGGGNLQPVMIAPGDVRQGSYTTERPLTGIEPGGFTITATVTRRSEEDQSQAPPNVATRADSGGGPQTAAGGTPGYNICGSGCGTYASEQGTGRIRCVTPSTCQARGTKCKCHLFRRPRNTNQDYEHVEGPNAWTDPEGGFEYVCRCVN